MAKVKEINYLDLKKLMRFQPTLCDTASYFDCSEDTISRLIQKNDKLTFWEFRERHFGTTRMKLREKALAMALSGDRHMMIFLLKNYCGMKENPEIYLEQINAELEFVHE